MPWVSGNHHNYTGDKASKYARLRVDNGQTGFFEGREFRSFYEFSIAPGATVVGKFVCPVDFILWSQMLSVDSSIIRLKAVLGGTEGGAFTSLPVIGKNRMVERRSPYYEARATIGMGGTHTGGLLVDVQRASAGTGGNASSHVALSDERGLPAGTYYLTLENVGSQTGTGVYSLWWEERPTDDFPVPYGPGSAMA